MLHLLRSFRFLDDDAKGGGGGGGAAGGAGDDEKKPKTKEELEDQLDKLANRRGGMKAVALEILEERIEDRQKIRRLNAELTAVKAPGARVISADEAKEFDAFKALGVKAEDAKKQLDRTAALEAESAKTQREKVTRQIAALEVYGYEPDALVEIVNAKGLHLELADEQVDDGKGKKTTRKIAKVRPAADEKAALVELSAYLAEHAKPLLPALTAKPAPTGTKAAPAAVQFPVQRSSSEDTGKPKGGIDDVIAKNAERAKAPNALRPAAPVTK